VLSVRVTCRGQAAPDAPTGFNPSPVQSIRCLTLIELGTDSTPDAQAQRPVPPRPAFGHDFSKLPGVIENIHLIFSKELNPAEQARQEGEINANPSLLFNLHLLLKVCQHHQVYTMMRKCVSIFTIILYEGVKLAH